MSSKFGLTVLAYFEIFCELEISRLTVPAPRLGMLAPPEALGSPLAERFVGRLPRVLALEPWDAVARPPAAQVLTAAHTSPYILLFLRPSQT